MKKLISTLVFSLILIGCEKNFNSTFDVQPRGEIYVKKFKQSSTPNIGFIVNGIHHYISFPYKLVDINSININDTSFLASSGETVFVKQKIAYVLYIDGNMYQIENIVNYGLTQIDYVVHNTGNYTIGYYDLYFTIRFSDDSKEEFYVDGADVKYNKTIDAIAYYNPINPKHIVDVTVSKYYLYKQK